MGNGTVSPCGDTEEQRLQDDPRLIHGVALFNDAEWYACHDVFEELWHETTGPMRPVLQALVQLAVAQLHWERGNLHGAMVLTGEGLGRLRTASAMAMGLNLSRLCEMAQVHLRALQSGHSQVTGQLPPLRLQTAIQNSSVDDL